MGPKPVRVTSVEAALKGQPATADAITAAAATAADGSKPTSDVHADAEFRSHLARVLTGRAIATAAGV
jgi:carbon-monoxide dehydrogenase medium subunit